MGGSNVAAILAGYSLRQAIFVECGDCYSVSDIARGEVCFTASEPFLCCIKILLMSRNCHLSNETFLKITVPPYMGLNSLLVLKSTSGSFTTVTIEQKSMIMYNFIQCIGSKYDTC